MNPDKTTYYIIGIVYVFGMTIWATTFIGKPACIESSLVPWGLPFEVLLLLGMPFLLGRWSK